MAPGQRYCHMQVAMEYRCDLCVETFTTQRGLDTHSSKSKKHAKLQRDADQRELKRQRLEAKQFSAQPPAVQPQPQAASGAYQQAPQAVQPPDTDAQVGACSPCCNLLRESV